MESARLLEGARLLFQTLQRCPYIGGCPSIGRCPPIRDYPSIRDCLSIYMKTRGRRAIVNVRVSRYLHLGAVEGALELFACAQAFSCYFISVNGWILDRGNEKQSISSQNFLDSFREDFPIGNCPFVGRCPSIGRCSSIGRWLSMKRCPSIGRCSSIVSNFLKPPVC